MKTSELEYELPPELIAQQPAETRDASRLLVLDRATRSMKLDVLHNLPNYLHAGDCLAMNDTRVIRARLRAKKTTGAQIELFLLRETAPGTWTGLVRPSARVKPGTKVFIADQVEATVGEILNEGQRSIQFDVPNVIQFLEQLGEIPLPPYITRSHPEDRDLTRYQTVYARSSGAVAAPTAGLHFTPELLATLSQMGIVQAPLTLHVGYGTFRPITVDELDDHVVDTEDFVLSEESAAVLNQSRAAGGRIVAIGTTSARVLETQYQNGRFCAGSGQTGLYIRPPYQFQAIDALQTNFHLPKSSLLALVCAFAGRDFVMEAYQLAIRERFRFYSYGDAMLIL